MVVLFAFSLLLVFYASAPALAQFDRPNFGVCNLQPFNPSLRTCGRRGISRADCLAVRRCCYTVFPRPRCYERGLRSIGLGMFRPSPVPYVQLPGGLGFQAGFAFGGEPGYPGSSFVRRCNGFFLRRCAGLPIGPYNPLTFPYSLNLYRSLCYRFGCCWNRRRRTCTLAQFFVTSLRNKCPPGFEDPPACRETNECADNPCENGGECVDAINSFSCECPVGIGGENCDQVCGAPPSVNNAESTTSDPLLLNVGETATYECEVGFRLEGTATIVCQSDGTYSPDPPECVRTCGPPDQLTNGVQFSDSPYPQGRTLDYSCNGILEIVPAGAQTTCQADGTWSLTEDDMDFPTCYCPSIPTIERINPSLTSTRHLPDTDVTYTCMGCIIAVPDNVLNRCNGNTGEWLLQDGDAELPQCRAECGSPDSVAGADIEPPNPPYDFGDTAAYICSQQGAALNPPGDNLCQNDGCWSLSSENNNLPECVQP